MYYLKIETIYGQIIYINKKHIIYISFIQFKLLPYYPTIHGIESNTIITCIHIKEEKVFYTLKTEQELILQENIKPIHTNPKAPKTTRSY